jgi:hypothetical protein
MLAAFDDPGGGLCAATVVNEIVRRDIADVVVYSGRLSKGFVSREISESYALASDLNYEDATKILEKESPDILFTSTGGGSAEQQLRNAARAMHIKSFVTLDFWKHYGRRWLYADHGIGEIKDLIFVMDKSTKEEMISEGFPEHQIVVTGHPYLDSIFNPDEEIKDRKGNSCKYLFLSQPSDTIGLGGYDVHPVAKVIAALNQTARNVRSAIELYVKLHPMEKNNDELMEIVSRESGPDVSVVLKSSEDDLNKLFEDCSTVMGYNSIALFEAAAKRKKVISLDVVPMNASLREAMSNAGIRFIQSDSEALAIAFSDDSTNIAPVRDFHKGAIDKCISNIFSEFRAVQNNQL